MIVNVLIAIFVAVALASWLVIGQMTNTDPASIEAAAVEKQLPSVRYRDSAAEPYAATITLRGKTEPARSSLLKAEIPGSILEIVAERGAPVKAGDLLIRLDPRNLPEQLAAAEANLHLREREHEAAIKLQASGYQSETRAAETAALLASARNEIAATRIALAHTEIRAPYDGVFNDRLVELGESVAIGDPIASFLQLDPMIIVAEATEAELRRIERDSAAIGKVNGQEVQGSIRYIAQAGNDAVRTYTIEFAFANPNLALPAGLTADIVVTAESQLAHKVTPAILFLSANTEGDLGIKTVEADGTVGFHRATIVGSAPDGVWVSGLPASARIITVGQGFVKPGFPVRAVDEATIQ